MNSRRRAGDRRYRRAVTLILHLGGPRHGHVAEVRDQDLASGILVYDGPQWFGVYEREQRARSRDTAHGRAELWVIRE